MISVWIHSFNKQFNLIITWTTNNKIIVSSTIGKQLLLHLVIILVISYVHTFISIQRQTRARICHVAYEFNILEAVRTFNLPTTLTAAFARRKKSGGIQGYWVLTNIPHFSVLKFFVLHFHGTFVSLFRARLSCLHPYSVAAFENLKMFG